MNIKKTIKERAQQVANINANGRKLKRKEDRELKEINKAFNQVVEYFQEQLFTTDWEAMERDGNDFDVFSAYNDIWVEFCNNWNKEKTHLIKAQDHAFNDWAMNNTLNNKNDKPCFITGNQLACLRWYL